MLKSIMQGFTVWSAGVTGENNCQRSPRFQVIKVKVVGRGTSCDSSTGI